jgi:hypothetical protein
MQNLAVMVHVHKFHSFDPFPMKGRPIHRSCTYVQQQQQRFCDFEVYFRIESSDVLMAAGWDRAAGHHQHPFCATFRIRFELMFQTI